MSEDFDSGLDSDSLVLLQCIKEGSKLRVKIISSGYNSTANCQFPRAIRKAGLKYAVPRHAISFAEGPNLKFFYRISKSYIKVLNEVELLTDEIKNLKVYGSDDEELECLICMSANKDAVFAPCGHFCACEECSQRIKNTTGKCPMCRTRIIIIVRKDQIE